MLAEWYIWLDLNFGLYLFLCFNSIFSFDGFGFYSCISGLIISGGTINHCLPLEWWPVSTAPWVQSDSDMHCFAASKKMGMQADEQASTILNIISSGRLGWQSGVPLPDTFLW